jgi:hypothetical protein
VPGKGRFTKKQDRQAAHIAASERKKGMSAKDAKSVGYATVNKNKKRKKKKPKNSASDRRKRNIGRS